jgi:hypothetical protein
MDAFTDFAIALMAFGAAACLFYAHIEKGRIEREWSEPQK